MFFEILLHLPLEVSSYFWSHNRKSRLTIPQLLCLYGQNYYFIFPNSFDSYLFEYLFQVLGYTSDYDQLFICQN